MHDLRNALSLLPALLLLVSLGCDTPGGSGFAALPTCNNGQLDPGEQCDGALVQSNTCQAAGYEGGTLVCNHICTAFDYSGCLRDTAPDAPDTNAPDTNAPDTNAPGTNSAPNILSLNANTTTLDAGATLIVTAVVTDPDGIDDLIGGQLEAATGGSYGAFSTSAAEGAYTIALTWNALNTVQAIDAPTAGTALDFKAIFYDVAGLRSERTLQITVRCSSEEARSLCDGTCLDLATDYNSCGACDNSCSDVPSFEAVPEHIRNRVAGSRDCNQGFCSLPLSADEDRIQAGVTCRTLCTEVGLSCPWPSDVMVGRVHASGQDVLLSCDQSYTWARVVTSAYCHCAPGTGYVDPPEPEPTPTSIVAIQSSPASTGCMPSSEGFYGSQDLQVEGIVVVPRFELNDTLSGLFLSDGSQAPYSGLLVRFATNQPFNFARGQRVRVTGRHQEYYCLTQIAASTITAIGDGYVPPAVVLEPNLPASELERWEGVAVQIDDVMITGATEYNDAETNAGVLIDDYVLGDGFVLPEIGSYLPVLRGILYYGFERYRVAPRDDSDY